MAILLSALVFLLPVLITPGILFHYDITPKIAVLCFLIAGCVVFPGRIAGGLGALWTRRRGRWLCAMAAMQAVWYGVAAALSSRPWFSLLGSNWRRMGLLTVVALSVFAVLAAAYLSERPEGLSLILRAFVAATIVTSIYGILQYFDVDPFQAAAAYHAEAGDSIIVRPPGTLGHADYFGWWLAIAFFCSVASARIEIILWKWLAIFACLLSGVAIVLSGTRSAILAVFAGFLAVAAFSGFRPGRKHLMAALLFVGLLAVFYFSPAGTRLRARVRWSSDEPTGGARPLLWRDSLRMAAARPWAGFGPETFAAEFPRYQSVDLARLLPDFYYESPHSTALDALTSEGIPGLMIALGWVFVGIWAAFQARRTHSKTGSALFAALVASCVASLFTAATAGPIFATLLVIAMLVALEPGTLPSPVIGRATVMACSAPIAICLAIFGAALAINDFQLARFQTGAGDTGNSIVRYNSLVRTELPGAAEDLYVSRRLATICGAGANPAVRADCVKTATRAAVRATGSSDNPPNAWYNLGMFSAEENNEATVEISLRRSALLAPNWFKPHWALAKLLALTGRGAEAKKEAARAVLLDAGKDAEVSGTLKNLTQQRP